MHKFLLGASLFFVSFVSHSSGDTFGGFQSDHEKLKGFYIVDVGNTEELRTPFDQRQTSTIYKLNSRCFTSYGYIGSVGYSGNASLLLVNEKKETNIAFIEKTISNVEVKIEPISLVECESRKSDFDKEIENCGSKENCLKIINNMQKKILQQYKENTLELNKSLSQ